MCISLRQSIRALLLVALNCTILLASDRLVAEDSEVKLGRREHEKLLETTHFYQNDELNAYVTSVGRKLAANSDWPEIEYHFFIIDSPDINAFALPGGYIYVNRGLLSYLTSEAQLAAVLAHEIAHVTRRHATKRRSQQRLGDVTAFVASIATLNSNVGQAIQLENAARVSGYGREMELEADEFGARYLYRSGYDPRAMMEVLGVLKNHERFSILKGREAGRAPSTYHGVFASHPRNDTRLRQVVGQAGQLPPGEDFRGRDIYRKKTDGMVFGDNDTTLAPPGYARYATRSLGVTFIYPDDWQRSTQGQKIVLISSDGITMEVSVARPQEKDASVEELLRSRYRVDTLRKSTALHDNRTRKDEAAYAFVETDAGDKRVAVIKSGSYEYYFEVPVPVPLSDEQDKTVLAVIRSFRRAENHDFPPDKIRRIYYHRLKPGETFADLAADHAIGRHSEQQLRLINGYYPSGEAEPGTWIKMVK